MDDPREADRLAAKVDPARWVEIYLGRYLSGARAILDVGCGPGVIAQEIARRCSDAEVIGIDLSADRFSRPDGDQPSRANLTLRVGDARALGFSENHFDLVYCRFLLEYLKERERAVGEMVRVCRPGGRILLQDLDGQLIWHYPADVELEELQSRVIAGLATTGFDPLVGRKLYTLAHRAGLTDIRVSVEGYHLIAGRIDDENHGFWEMKLDIALPSIAKVLGELKAAQDLRDRFLEYLRREDTLTYSVLFTVIGTKPPT